MLISGPGENPAQASFATRSNLAPNSAVSEAAIWPIFQKGGQFYSKGLILWISCRRSRPFQSPVAQLLKRLKKLCFR